MPTNAKRIDRQMHTAGDRIAWDQHMPTGPTARETLGLDVHGPSTSCRLRRLRAVSHLMAQYDTLMAAAGGQALVLMPARAMSVILTEPGAGLVPISESIPVTVKLSQ